MKNGVLLAAKFAFPPNSFGYCGKKTFIHALKQKDCRLLKSELKHFRAHFAYLSLIARANRLKPFDRRVVNAFWIGNKLLENVSEKTLQNFITHELFPANLSRAKKLCKSLPKGILPHHSFHVLYVNFLSQKVKRSIQNYDKCCITSGRVLSCADSTAYVERFSIKKEKNGKPALGKKREELSLERKGVRLAGKLKRNDLLAIHWGMAVKRLSKREAAELKEYTRRNIDAINKAR